LSELKIYFILFTHLQGRRHVSGKPHEFRTCDDAADTVSLFEAGNSGKLGKSQVERLTRLSHMPKIAKLKRLKPFRLKEKKISVFELECRGFDSRPGLSRFIFAILVEIVFPSYVHT
jgi:hypothetical protein